MAFFSKTYFDKMATKFHPFFLLSLLISDVQTNSIHSLKKVSGHFANFLYKTAFLKSKFEDDPVRVQKRNISHFKGLEQTFKMRYITSLNSYWIQKYQPSKLKVRKKVRFSTKTEVFFRMFNFDGWWRPIQQEFRDVLYLISKVYSKPLK